MRNSLPPTSRALDANSPRSALLSLPPDLERRIAARWKEWEAWVWMDLRHRGIAPLGSSEIARLRQQHADHIVDFMQKGLTMRLVRRHRLDDPRIPDELRTVLVRRAIERCRKATVKYRLAARSTQDVTTQSAATGNAPHGSRSSKLDLASRNIFSSEYKSATIDLIRKGVSERFYLRELRDQDLKARSHRQIITFPRQLAMYIARQLTTASLPEIGRQFGGIHHTTVMHSIRKIEHLRRWDKDADGTIRRLIDALQQQ
jgi:hypothetical protein